MFTSIFELFNCLFDWNYDCLFFKVILFCNYFREGLEHANITFNDNGTVTAIPKHPLTYIAEKSAGAEDDVLFLPNIALLVSLNYL